MEFDLRALERSALANPGDAELLAHALASFHRAGRPPPAALLSARTFAAQRVESGEALSVQVELPSGVRELAGETPGAVEVPACRQWWVRPQATEFTPELFAALTRLGAPGLSLVRKRLFLPQLAKLADLRELEWLSLRASGLRDEDLVAFPESPGLSELDLSGSSRLTARGLAALERAPLVRLALDSCPKLTDLDALRALPRLRYLSLSGSQLSLSRAHALSRLPLTHLRLSQARVTPPRLKEIAKLASLQLLDLSGSPLQDPALLTPLAHLTHLSIGLRDDRSVQLPLDALARLRSLKTLRLWHATDTLAPLAELPALRTLALGRCDERTWRSLAELPQLESLGLGFVRGPDTDALFDVLEKLPRLRRFVYRALKAPTPPRFAARVAALRARGVACSTARCVFERKRGVHSPWVEDAFV